MNNGTNVVVPLGGVETLKATAGPGAAAGDVNAHFYMFVPVVSTLAPFPLSASLNAGAISIKFQTLNSHNYTVLYSTNLNSPNWQTLTNLSGDGTVKTATDTASQPLRFYRVQAQ